MLAIAIANSGTHGRGFFLGSWAAVAANLRPSSSTARLGRDPRSARVDDVRIALVRIQALGVGLRPKTSRRRFAWLRCC